MASDIDICNLALVRIGQGVPIASLGEASEAATQCNALLPLLRDLVLGDADWNFARRRQALALLTEDPTGTWTHTYRTPTGCLRPLYIEPERQRIPYESGGDDAGGLILTLVDNAVLVYTERLEDLSRWTHHAADALAWRLAADLALVLARDSGRSEDCRRQYRLAFARSAANSANAGRPQASTYTPPGLTRTDGSGTLQPRVET